MCLVVGVWNVLEVLYECVVTEIVVKSKCAKSIHVIIRHLVGRGELSL